MVAHLHRSISSALPDQRFIPSQVSPCTDGEPALPGCDCSKDAGGAYLLDNKKYSGAKYKPFELKHLGKFVESHRRNGDIAESLLAAEDWKDWSKTAYHLRECGAFVLFAHDLDREDYRIRGANFCRQHKFCQACAARRSVRALQVYRPKLEELQKEHPNARYYFTTFTMRSMEDPGEMFDCIAGALGDMFKAAKPSARAQRKVSSWNGYLTAVVSFESTWNEESGFHIHAHALVLSEVEPDRTAIIAEWAERIGQTFEETWNAHTDYGRNPDGFCKAIYSDDDGLSDAILEVFKYSVKMSCMPIDKQIEFAKATKGKRFLRTYGLIRRPLKVLEEDDPHDEEIRLILHFYSRVDEHPSRGVYRERCVAYEDVPIVHDVVANHEGPIECGCRRCNGSPPLLNTPP